MAKTDLVEESVRLCNGSLRKDLLLYLHIQLFRHVDLSNASHLDSGINQLRLTGEKIQPLSKIISSMGESSRKLRRWPELRPGFISAQFPNHSYAMAMNLDDCNIIFTPLQRLSVFDLLFIQGKQHKIDRSFVYLTVNKTQVFVLSFTLQ